MGRKYILLSFLILVCAFSYSVLALSITVNSPSNPTYSNGNISISVTVDQENSTCMYGFTSPTQAMVNSTPSLFGASVEKKAEADYVLYFNCSSSFNDVDESVLDQVNFALDFCTPLWQAVTGACQINDLRWVNYTDANDCFAKTGLSSDTKQNTTESCNYCSENLQVHYTDWSSCSSNQKTRIRYYTDNNYAACCAITGLASDCDNQNVTETESCDSCEPEWLPQNGSCRTDDSVVQSYYDTNDCYASSGSSSDNNPPSSITSSCDFCTPDWTSENSTCENETLVQSYIDRAKCYEMTSLSSDLQNRTENKTLECRETTLLTSSAGSENKKSAITGSVVSAISANKGIILFVAGLLIVAFFIYRAFNKQSKPWLKLGNIKSYGFN